MRALTALLLLAGCSPCVQLCTTEGAHLNRCLDDWDLGWADVGAASRADHRLRCERDQRRLLRLLDDDETLRAEEQARCAAVNTRLRAAATCEQTWAVLTEE